MYVVYFFNGLGEASETSFDTMLQAVVWAKEHAKAIIEINQTKGLSINPNTTIKQADQRLY